MRRGFERKQTGAASSTEATLARLLRLKARKLFCIIKQSHGPAAARGHQDKQVIRRDRKYVRQLSRY